jgi:hypothetical protein
MVGTKVRASGNGAGVQKGSKYGERIKDVNGRPRFLFWTVDRIQLFQAEQGRVFFPVLAAFLKFLKPIHFASSGIHVGGLGGRKRARQYLARAFLELG